MENRDTSAAKAQTQGLIARLAGRFGVEPNRLLKCLTTQVFKQADGRQPSNEELMVLLLVCENFARLIARSTHFAARMETLFRLSVLTVGQRLSEARRTSTVCHSDFRRRQ